MDSKRSPEFDRLIARVASELESSGLRFMLIGGQAVLLHGEPRLTQDIDITLGAGPAETERVLALCDALGLAVLADEPIAFARRTFVLPTADPASRIRVDFVFSTTPYEQQAIARAVHVDLQGVRVPFASAEDLILHKLFAGRARDVEDVRGIVVRQAGRLDWPYLERWARDFVSVPGREKLPDLIAALRADAEPGPGGGRP